jgi:transposase
MHPNRLQVGIDFSQKRADFCLLFPDGQPLLSHQAFTNSHPGYQKARQMLLDTLRQYAFDGLDVSGEATSYYWLPFFWHLAHDAELTARDLSLYLLNPRQVHWFKKSLPPDDKTDNTDPFYIAERTRTRRPSTPWQPQDDWLPLRFYTRLRFHLVQNLTREKNYYLIHLFLLHSTYQGIRPFSNPFGVTSQHVLGDLTQSDGPTLAELAKLPLEELAEQLEEWSSGTLEDPLETARKLQQVAIESFPLDEPLLTPVLRILDHTQEHITFLQQQIAQVEQWIEAEVQAHHPQALFLDTVPGVGLVLAAGIVAEIGDLQRFFQTPKWDRKRKRYHSRTLREVEDAVAKLAGLWWPKVASGDFVAEDRHLAKTCNRYLRYYLIQAANGMHRHIPAYARFFNRKFREVNRHKYKRALVLTARKSIGLFVGLLHRKEAYRSEEG